MKFEYDQSVTRQEALDELTNRWAVEPATCEVPLPEALGRVTAKDMRALLSLPVVRSSQRDGIAVRSSDFADGVPDTTGWVRGRDFAQADTGDDFPDGFDAVIAIESVEYREDGTPSIIDPNLAVSPGSSVNPSGSIIREGTLIVSSRTRLEPECIAALAVGGYAAVEVLEQPKVTFVPTGSELVEWGTRPKRGQNIEANSLLVSGMLAQWGAEARCAPIVRDDRCELERALDSALAGSDIVLINGGSSRGEEDYNSRLLQARASFFRHGVKAVPGRPVGIAIIDGKPVVNVPGPVLATFLCMDWLVRGLIACYYGMPVLGRQTVQACLGCSISKPAQFEKLVRVSLRSDEQGAVLCEPISAGGVVETLLASDGLLVLPIGESVIEEGTEVGVELFRQRVQIGL